MNIRESIEQRELKILSPYAAHSVHTRGREVIETECDIRTVYQRDRDRILHCKAFRRLKDKTQVFLAPQGDHYRNRMTHTLEVSQIARTIARALCLNEDLTEAISLGHDLGHTPFGHAGERALNEIHTEGFAHYKQSVRVAQVLEKDGKGLNLSWEVCDGIFNHRLIGNPKTLEGQIVRFADKLAYLHHDMDDARRANVFFDEDIPVELRKTLGNTTRERLNTLIHNIIEFSENKPWIGMSDEIMEAFIELRKIMYKNVYDNPTVKKEEDKAVKMIKELYNYYNDHPLALSKEYFKLIEDNEGNKSEIVCDYLSGMTDQYSMEKFREIFIPKSWQVY